MRGASMGILNVDHPEILDFIRCKMDGSVTNFNLSVGITNEFMYAVFNDDHWGLTFNDKVYRRVRATNIWKLIAECAHACGDPGLIFLDAHGKGNPMKDRVINATNPCGEIGLSVGESCLLASISLEKFVNPRGVDLNELGRVTKLGVRFLDNLIDIGEYPLPIIDEMTKDTRKIGLGITGLADMLIMNGCAYDAPEGRQLAEQVMSHIFTVATNYSTVLGGEKGSFPSWKNSIFADENTPRRNATCITIAPTGSVTTIAGCEGYGIEPIFAIAYRKATEVAGEFNVFSPLFLEKTKHLNLPQGILDDIAMTGSCQHIEEIPENIRQLFKGANEISPSDHIKMQIALQQYVDNAVSKTVGTPNKATVRDILNIYQEAYEGGLKGITVFRDGCKQGVITVGATTSEEDRGHIEPRPESADGTTTCLRTGCGKIYLTVNFLNDRPIETFITTGSTGGCLAYTEATSRLISLALRGGISVEDICEQLNSTHACASYQLARGRGKELSPGKSCASAISKQLMQYIKAKQEVANGDVCPSCGEPTYHRAEGCWVCEDCGYSKC